MKSNPETAPAIIDLRKYVSDRLSEIEKSELEVREVERRKNQLPNKANSADAKSRAAD